MTTFLVIVGVITSIVVLVLAAIGVATITGLVDGLKRSLQRQRVDAAEQSIGDLGRAAQIAILEQALRRATSADREPRFTND